MSRTLLHIDSSARGNASDSSRLSAAFTKHWLESHPQDRVVIRDIISQPLPHLDETLLNTMFTPKDQHTPDMTETASRTDELVEEFLAADVVVIGAPMYNFGIPSTLKAWVDNIAQAGRTFRYTQDGPVGLAGGKQVFVLSTRGGVYDNSPLDHQAVYLKHLFGFLGIEDVTIIQAEGLALSEKNRKRSLAEAHESIKRIVGRRAEAA